VDISAIATSLDKYSLQRRAAENAYYAEYSNWLDRLTLEHNEYEAEYFERNPTEWLAPLRPASNEPMETLISILVVFVKSEFRAFAKQLGHLSILEILTVLDQHKAELLAETRARKWTPAYRILERWFEGETLIDQWTLIEAELDELLWDRLQPAVWRCAPQWEGLNGSIADLSGVLEAEEKEAVLARARRDSVDQFLSKCRKSFPGIKFHRRHIWRAVGHKCARQFQFWQAAHSKATIANDKDFKRILALRPEAFEKTLRDKKIIEA
jgi:hypothetical protein